MGSVIVTIRVMPSGVGVDLSRLEKQASLLISDFGGGVGKVEVEPIAFGLKALKIVFVMDEGIGSTEGLEEKISKLKNVESVVVEDVRRAIG